MNAMMRTFFTVLIVAFGFMAACSDDGGTTNNGEDKTAPTAAFKFIVTQNPSGGNVTLGVEANATDNVGVTKVEFFVDGQTTPAATATQSPWAAVISAPDPGEGTKTVSLKAYDAAGNVTTTNDAYSNNTRLTLVEIVTSANCIPCVQPNEAFKAGTSSEVHKMAMAVIKNHVWIPRKTDELYKVSETWVKPRTFYLFHPKEEKDFSAPNCWVGGQSMGSVATSWLAQIPVDHKAAAEAKITLGKTDNGSTVDLRAVVKGVSSSGYSELRLHTVVTETDIAYQDGNGEFIHYNVMRRMYPDADGQLITLANGEEKEFTTSIAIDPTWNKDNLEVIVFIQADKTTKKILQAAKLRLK